MTDTTNPALYSTIERLKAENLRLRDSNQRLLADATNRLCIAELETPTFNRMKPNYFDGFRAALQHQMPHHAGCTNAPETSAWDAGYKAACEMGKKGAIEYIAQYAAWKAGQGAYKKEITRWHRWDAYQAERSLLWQGDVAAMRRRRDRQIAKITNP